jgi:hypothetical protein
MIESNAEPNTVKILTVNFNYFFNIPYADCLEV